MSSLSISKAWDETKASVARDGRLIGAVALALILLPQAIAGALVPSPALSGEQAPAWFPLLSLIVAVIEVTGQIAIVRLTLQPTSVGEAIAHAGRRVPGMIGAALLLVLPLMLVLIVVLLAVAGPGGMDAIAKGGSVPSGLALVIVLFFLAAMAVTIRFLMAVPVAAMDSGNPITILQRSWDLTRGHYLRLLGFLFAILFLAVVLLLVAEMSAGILARVAFGDVKPMSLGALLVALVSGAAQAVFAALTTMMLARIYAQLAGRGARGAVPKSGT